VVVMRPKQKQRVRSRRARGRTAGGSSMVEACPVQWGSAYHAIGNHIWRGMPLCQYSMQIEFLVDVLSVVIVYKLQSMACEVSNEREDGCRQVLLCYTKSTTLIYYQ
jgi:hypothetical protein